MLEYTALRNLKEDNALAVVTLVCEDGQQVAMNCIYIQSISVKCEIADISDQFVFNVKLHRYPINLSQQRRVGSSMCQLLNMQQLTNFWTDECEVRFKDLLYAKHGIFYKDNCGHIKEVLVAVLHILVHISVYNKKY